MENEGQKGKTFRQFSSKYETIDLDRHETEISESMFQSLTADNHIYCAIMRWILVFFTGVLVSILHIISRNFRILLICNYIKPALIRAITNDFPHNLGLTFAVWIAFHVVCVFTGTALCVFIEPLAGGNDITSIHAFFNGILTKNLLTLKTALVMYISMIAQLPGGAGGTEVGPMIKISALVGYLLPKVYLPLKVMLFLRLEKERRNLALCGMAAGVAATLNAPLTGTLIAIEHARNNLNTILFQQVFFCSWVAKIFSQFALMAIFNFYLNKQSIDYKRFAIFGQINHVEYQNFEFIVYILVGVCGGVLGCLWKYLTLQVSKIRDYLSAGTKTCLLMEGILWPATIACFHISLLYLFRYEPCLSTTKLLMDEIKPNVTSPQDFFTMPNVTCSNNTEMPQAGIPMIFPDHIVTFLIHCLPKTFNLMFLASLFIFMYFHSMITAGMCVSSGLFIYHIILGTLWGRILGEYLYSWTGEEKWCHPNKIALLGAAAQMSGVFHYRLATVAFLIESTGSYQAYTIPLLITSVVAHSVAHIISSLTYYGMIIKYNGMPFLSPNIPYNDITPVTEIMAHPVIQVPLITTVSTIMDVLSKNKGRYPVSAGNGVLLGDLSRNYLCSMLLNKVQDREQPVRVATFKPIFPKLWEVECTIEYFEKAMKNLRENLTANDLAKKIHLGNFYNSSFHMITPETNVAGAYTFVRQTAVHTLYVTKQGRCLGVITRKDVIEARDKNKKMNNAYGYL